MDTEDKITHLKALQSEIGKPSTGESSFTPKSTKQEFIELLSGVLVTVALVQYLYFGVQSLDSDNAFPLISGPVILTILCLSAERIYPIQKVQEGEPGLASAYNYLAVNILFFWFAEAAISLAMLALVFSIGWFWDYALFLAYPVVLIEWIKRKNKGQNKKFDSAGTSPVTQ